MATTNLIPLYDFNSDDASIVPFYYLSLDAEKDYNTASSHRHNYYEIMIFLQGGGTHEIDFQPHSILTNSVHFISPGQVHCMKRAVGSKGFVISFSSFFYLEKSADKNMLFDLPFLNNNGGLPILNLSKEEIQPLLPILEGIAIEEQSKNAYRADILRSFLNIFLLKAQQLYALKYPELSFVKTSEVYKKFRILLENNFIQKHKVKEYADALSVSEKMLTDTVKKTTGKTASEHIFERIILEAKRLLKHSHSETKEIAYFLGFQDPTHFSKFFKTQTGYSPKSYKDL